MLLLLHTSLYVLAYKSFVHIYILHVYVRYGMNGHPDTTGMDFFLTSKVEPKSVKVTSLHIISVILVECEHMIYYDIYLSLLYMYYV